MRQLGEMNGNIPRPFGQAERSMRDSRQALEQGQPGQAIDPQGQAIDQLQQGARMATEQLMQQLGQGRGQQPGGQQQGFGDMNTSFDPFGRPMTRSEEHTSELQSLMRISYAVFCLKKKKTKTP